MPYHVKSILFLLVFLGLSFTAQAVHAETVITDNQNYTLRLPDGWKIADKETNKLINALYAVENHLQEKIPVGYSFKLSSPLKRHTAIGYVYTVPIKRLTQTKAEKQSTLIGFLLGMHTELSRNGFVASAQLDKAELLDSTLYTAVKLTHHQNEPFEGVWISSRNMVCNVYNNRLIFVVIVFTGEEVEKLYPLAEEFKDALTPIKPQAKKG